MEDESELRLRLISAAKWSAFLRATSQVISWLVTIIVVRLLTPQDYGLNAMLEVPIELLMLFSTLGFEMALIQKRRMSREELRPVFGALLVVNGLFFLVIFFGASLVADYYKEPRLVLLLQVASVIFLLSPFRTIPNALLDRDLEFKLRAQVDMAAMVMSSLLSLGLAIGGAGAWALVAALVANYALRSVILAWLKPWLVVPSLAFGQVKELVYYGGVITISGALLVMSGKAVSLIAGPALGAQLLGLYAVALVFALLPMSKIMPIVQQTMYPAYARLQDHPKMAQKYLTKSLELSSLIMFPMFIGMACISEHFVLVVFGEQWLPMAFSLALLATFAPLRMVTQVCVPALNALGHARSTLVINLSLLFMLVTGAFISIGRGLMAVILVWLVAAPVIAAMTLLVVRRLIGVRINQVVISVMPASIGSLVMAAPLLAANLWLPEGVGLPRLVVEIIGGAVLYTGTIYFLFRNLVDEIRTNLFRSN